MEILLRQPTAAPPGIFLFLNAVYPLAPFEWILVFYRSISAVLTLLISTSAKTEPESSSKDELSAIDESSVNNEFLYSAAESLFTQNGEMLSR